MYSVLLVQKHQQKEADKVNFQYFFIVVIFLGEKEIVPSEFGLICAINLSMHARRL